MESLTAQATRFGSSILDRADTLAAISERPAMLARSYLTAQHRQAGERVLAWMREAGMRADFDPMGNVIGRYEGANAGAPAIVSGSHLDTVIDAGKYDGIFGILAPIACVAELHRGGSRLAFPVEVIAFGDEEGTRFGASMLGSKALAGAFHEELLDRRDAEGVSLREALGRFGGDAAAIARLRRDPASIRVFIETHIEQGPVLLEAGLPVGVVTTIAGASRVHVKVEGEEGHAGTVPMALRRDALAAACEMVLAVERRCRATDGRIVGTVGKISVREGGAINVIPARVEFTLDVRSGDDVERRRAVKDIESEFLDRAAARGVHLEWTLLEEVAATPCDAIEQERLGEVIRAMGMPVRRLPSGAGHDAMQLARVSPIAMLFVRCGNGGVSHSPRETLSAEDAGIASVVLLRYLQSVT